MVKEISHTADVAYEIYFKDLKELFCDIISVLRKHASFIMKKVKVEKEYPLKDSIEDTIFDITNEMIFNIDSGWIPERVEVENDRVKILYREASVLSFPIKALTYHMLKMERMEDEVKRVRVVFDI